MIEFSFDALLSNSWLSWLTQGAETFANFQFLRPWWLLLLLPILGLAWLVKQELVQASAWQAKMSAAVLHHLTINKGSTSAISPQQLLIVFLALATLLLAGPSWQRQASPFLMDDSEVIIALDLSNSMQTSDLKPSRLHSAKDKVEQLIEARGEAKTALIAFAGSAHVAMPLTQDSTMAKHFLKALNESSIANPQKNLATVLPKVSQVLNNSSSPATLVLVTDDTNTEIIKQYKSFFYQRHSKLNLVIWSINDSEMVANEHANERLHSLADATNGDLVSFSSQQHDLNEVLNLIDSNMVLSGDDDMPWLDSGYGLLFILAMLHLLWFRKGWTIQWQ